MSDEYDFTDAPSIVLGVRLGAAITVSPYNGPITLEVIAQHIKRIIEDGGIEQLIEKVNVIDVSDCQENSFFATPLS